MRSKCTITVRPADGSRHGDAPAVIAAELLPSDGRFLTRRAVRVGGCDSNRTARFSTLIHCPVRLAETSALSSWQCRQCRRSTPNGPTVNREIRRGVRRLLCSSLCGCISAARQRSVCAVRLKLQARLFTWMIATWSALSAPPAPLFYHCCAVFGRDFGLEGNTLDAAVFDRIGRKGGNCFLFPLNLIALSLCPLLLVPRSCFLHLELGFLHMTLTHNWSAQLEIKLELNHAIKDWVLLEFFVF